MRDITLGNTIYIKFTTRAFATGVPTTLAGTPVLSVYEENNLIQITAGVSIAVDYDSVTGLNQATIVATSGNGYEVDKSYDLVITTGTVGGVSVAGEVVGSFTVESAAVHKRIGAPAGASIAADLVVIDDFVDALETRLTATRAGYLDNLSGGAVALQATLTALNNLSAAQVNAEADTALSDFFTSAAAFVDLIMDEPLTGATHNVTDSLGKRIRDLQEFGSYEGGAVFIDTINGAAGTTDYESGTILNPVNTIAAANTLAASLNLSRFEVAPASSITFAASQTGQIFKGVGWTLAFGGQDVSNSEIIGAQSVTGIALTPTGEVHLIDCEVVSGTLGQAHLKFCGLGGTITLSAAANYTLSNCYSQIPGSPTPIIDFGAAVGGTGLSMRNYSGGIEIQNYGVTGTDTMSIEGNGQLIINANCTGGTIYRRGNFKVTNNSGGAVTVVDDDNTSNIIAILADTNELQTNQGNWVTAVGFATEAKQDIIDTNVDTALTNQSAIASAIDDIPTVPEFEARTPTAGQLLYMTRHAATALPVTFTGGTTTTAILGNVDGVAASSVDDVYNSRLLVFNAGTLNEQVCQITDYVGSTKTATITAVTTAVTSSHTAVLV